MKRSIQSIIIALLLAGCSGSGNTVLVKFPSIGDVEPETEVYYNARQIGQVLYVQNLNGQQLLTLQFNGKPRPQNARFYIQQHPFLRDQIFCDSIGGPAPGATDTLQGSFVQSSYGK